MAHPFAPVAPSAAQRFDALLSGRLEKYGPFDVRLGCEAVHVSTVQSVADLLGVFRTLDAGRQTAVLAILEKAG